MSLNVQPRFRAAETGLPVAAPIQGKTSPTLSPASSVKTASTSDGFSFFDVLDIINPLQHIPIIGGVYRAVTGDKIHNFSRVAGGALFGGVAGAALGLVNAVTVEKTGSDMGQMVLAKVGFGDNKKQEPAITDTLIADIQEEKQNKADDTQFAQTVEPHQIPNAMRDALIKYQEMKSTDMTPATRGDDDGSIRPRRYRDTLPPDRVIGS